MSQPPANPETPESTPEEPSRESGRSLRKLHWYNRIPEGGRVFFWAVYFGIFVVSAVAGIVIALVMMSHEHHRLMYQPHSSLFILVTGTFGEMWCFHRSLNLYMLSRPGKAYARWAIYVAGGALTLSFLLAVAIVFMYMLQ
ncbi:MAG TPA: hypothetical protein VL860_09390 [Planctomycetota bacterium]|nr:hypothetical protein [Planctomycetota bacterium]